MFKFLTAKKKRRASNARNKTTALPPRMLCAGVYCALAVLAGASAYAYQKFYIQQSDRYALREINIDCGTMYTQDEIREKLGLEKGQNLFKVCDLAAARAKLMSAEFGAKSVTLTRHLPDRLEVKVIEREPVASLAGEPRRLVDNEGFVFAGVWSKPLPLITGTPDKTGEPLQKMGRAATLFAHVLRETGVKFPVEKIDVSPEDFIILTLPGARTVKLAWEGIDRGDGGDENTIQEKLRLLIAMVNEAPPDARTFDARIPGKIYVSNSN